VNAMPLPHQNRKSDRARGRREREREKKKRGKRARERLREREKNSIKVLFLTRISGCTKHRSQRVKISLVLDATRSVLPASRSTTGVGRTTSSSILLMPKTATCRSPRPCGGTSCCSTSSITLPLLTAHRPAGKNDLKVRSRPTRGRTLGSTFEKAKNKYKFIN